MCKDESDESARIPSQLTTLTRLCDLRLTPVKLGIPCGSRKLQTHSFTQHPQGQSSLPRTPGIETHDVVDPMRVYRLAGRKCPTIPLGPTGQDQTRPPLQFVTNVPSSVLRCIGG